MSHVRKIAIAVCTAIVLLTGIGAFLTRGVMEHLSFLQRQQGEWSGSTIPHGIVDQRPWQTASTLSTLADSTEEHTIAEEAERLADHEVDQAFAQSLRQASVKRTQLQGRSLELERRVKELQQTIAEDSAHVRALSPSDGSLGKSQALGESSPNELDLAKAQLGLDQSELADSVEDLAQESGDQRVKLQQELSAREASMKKYQAGNTLDNGQTAVTSAERNGTLARQMSVWWKQHTRMPLIKQAEQLARADMAALTADHTRIEEEAREAAELATRPGRGASRLDDLQRASSARLVLSILNDRLGAQQQLAALYVRWRKQVESQRRIVVHMLLQTLSFTGLIVLFVLLAGSTLQRLLDRISHDRRQRDTLRTMVSVGTQAIGLLLVLLVIFGVPQQTPTILGLATAGLTVVFQDFILAFCGWFVLMRKNGIRAGDWVEIDSIGGEVVEVGVFRTWLLETGNWTANGHPTGRRISFLNSFAIRGKYFNFSTASQWMWDEIKVNIPAGANTYSLIGSIRDATVEATEADASMAEEEWLRVTHEEGSPQFSAKPSVDVRPAGNGVDIVVRYITRAGLRLEARNKLFGRVVELMQNANGGDAAL